MKNCGSIRWGWLLLIAASWMTVASAQRTSFSKGLADEFLRTYGSSASQLLGEVDFSALTASPDRPIPEIKSGPFLRDEASEMLQSGNQPLAMELYFAHAVTEYAQAQEVLDAMRFSSLLRRPLWQIRWGVSLAVRGGDADKANPIPVSAASDGGSPGAGMPENEVHEKLESALGLVAVIVAEELKSRLASGKFGTMIRALDPGPNAEADTVVAGNAFRSTTPTAEALIEEDVASSSALRTAPKPPALWFPGIVFVGEGASTEMTEVAQHWGLDFLLHFDVALKTGRDDRVDNTSRCRLIQVSTASMLAASKGIDREEARRFTRADRGSASEYIKDQLSLVLTIIDQKTTVIEMPTISAEIAKQRVGALLSASRLPGAKKPSLRNLAEIRAYQARGLLDESEINQAFDFVGGTDGLFLLHGPHDERLEAARQWAVDALPTPASK